MIIHNKYFQKFRTCNQKNRNQTTNQNFWRPEPFPKDQICHFWSPKRPSGNPGNQRCQKVSEKSSQILKIPQNLHQRISKNP